MKASQFRELTEEELGQKLSDLKDDLFKLQIRHSIAKLENPIKIREGRREIARLQTVMKELQALKKKETAGEGTQMEARK
ncbi:MAG: 50S ribosomal protein L29 [bacterium]|jgi:large subunit ribosomal protein L29